MNAAWTLAILVALAVALDAGTAPAQTTPIPTLPPAVVEGTRLPP